MSADWEAWLAARAEEVAGPAGHVALTGTYTVFEPLVVDGVPGIWDVDGGRLTVTVEPGAQLTRDGTPLTGTSYVDGDLEAPGVTVRTFVREGTPVVRTYEHAAPARAAFRGVDRYPYEPKWRVPAVFEPFTAPEPAAIPYQRDDVVREHVVPGELAFTLAGTPHRVRAFEGHGGLWFVFADATTGVSTYRPGRFVEALRTGDGYVVDFNRAYLPPCAFSDWYNCPLPPRENVLSSAVEAGEKSVLGRAHPA
ncbi:DUF1684 domain-containing protein [Dactylosporangium fulvum]|uniref:DUF1684 domain-containing protein n=1 Tax=Dactylosporangium fulvum TaxID=53359 RepID=A0ABY5W950_9ACTN|nr:DUF1684 domain-containing protein [Dactylosporangium fulvum]UWP85213.1 DUF1684 domain-containing protein [Dactylosporangium fulvum]